MDKALMQNLTVKEATTRIVLSAAKTTSAYSVTNRRYGRKIQIAVHIPLVESLREVQMEVWYSSIILIAISKE